MTMEIYGNLNLWKFIKTLYIPYYPHIIPILSYIIPLNLGEFRPLLRRRRWRQAGSGSTEPHQGRAQRAVGGDPVTRAPKHRGPCFVGFVGGFPIGTWGDHQWDNIHLIIGKWLITIGKSGRSSILLWRYMRYQTISQWFRETKGRNSKPSFIFQWNHGEISTRGEVHDIN